MAASRKVSGSLHTDHHGYDDTEFPFFMEPAEIGSFSLDFKRTFHNDHSQMKKYVPPENCDQCQFDLCEGYDKTIQIDDSIIGNIDNLLQWIMKNEKQFYISGQAEQAQDRSKSRLWMTLEKFSDKQSTRESRPHTTFNSLNTDFVCWRGLLKRLLCLPYENRDDLLVAVIKYRGTHFLCEFDSEAQLLEYQHTTARQKEMCFWGFKFEQYVTTDLSNTFPDTSRPVNTKEAFFSVARSRLQSHSLVYCAEVDCIDLTCQKGNKYVELKTSRIMETQRQHENFCRFKLIKWWAQSFLIGIPRVVCGFRDDDGAVRHLTNYCVKEMPTLARDTLQRPWNPAVCFNFLDSFLSFLKSNVREDNERCVYVVRWQPGTKLTLECAGLASEFHFLPDWFLSWEAWDKPY